MTPVLGLLHLCDDCSDALRRWNATLLELLKLPIDDNPLPSRPNPCPDCWEQHYARNFQHAAIRGDQ